MKRRGLWIVSIILALVLFVIGYIIIKQDIDAYKIGDTIERDGIAVTLNSVKWNKEDKGQQLEKGYKTMIVDVTVENKKEKVYHIWPVSFTMESRFGEILTEESVYESLAPGNKVDVKIAYTGVWIRRKKRFRYYFYDDLGTFIIKDIE